MSQLIAVLGRQPALGIAELESLLGAKSVQPLNGAALLKIDQQSIDINRLGGCQKIAIHLTTLNSLEWAVILKYIITALPQYLKKIPEGKIRFGLSVYGLPIKPATINRSGLEIKKIIKRNGRSVRIIPNTIPELSTAQTIHNQLTGPTGFELLILRYGKQTLLGQVINVQDINAYAARDQKRPMRDSKVGMLPPKLAQIIINLATTRALKLRVLENETTNKTIQKPAFIDSPIILDPFCGTGVVLQEALLMGYKAYGTDLDSRMVEYSSKNIEWIGERYLAPKNSYKIEVGDATNATWHVFDSIACETYLGRPFSIEPQNNTLKEVMQDVDTIIRKFLINITRQTNVGFRMCLALPAWKTKTGFKHLKMLDSLEDLGYTRLSFAHINNDQLVYYRPGQIVARELVVLVRK